MASGRFPWFYDSEPITSGRAAIRNCARAGLRVRREGTSWRRGDRASGLQLRRPHPSHRPDLVEVAVIGNGLPHGLGRSSHWVNKLGGVLSKGQWKRARTAMRSTTCLRLTTQLVWVDLLARSTRLFRVAGLHGSASHIDGRWLGTKCHRDDLLVQLTKHCAELVAQKLHRSLRH